MSFLSKIFGTELSDKIDNQNKADMNAKEKQLFFIKNSLKPLLKTEGYKTEGNKWWKINEPYFNVIELQNFSWNLRNSVDFCFNFTTGLISDAQNPNKPTIHDGIPYVRESYFGVTKNEYWKKGTSYHINDNTDLSEFSEQVLNDFNTLVLPKFNLLTNENAIVNFYSDDFWEPQVKEKLVLGRKNINVDN